MRRERKRGKRLRCHRWYITGAASQWEEIMIRQLKNVAEVDKLITLVNLSFTVS